MTDSPISIDLAKCTGCGACAKQCGFGALRLVDAPNANRLGRVAEVDPSACRACSACVKACPFKAITENHQKVVGTDAIDAYRDIWVFAERNENGSFHRVAFELLSKGLELKKQRGDSARLCAVVFGDKVADEETKALANAGADAVYVVEDPSLKAYEANVYADALADLAKRYRPEVIIAGATAVGRAFFARVAVRLRTGLTADCTALEIAATENPATHAMQMLLHQTRPAFGGNIMATIMTPNHRPQMATARPGVFKRRKDDAAREIACEIIREKISLAEPPTKLANVVRDLSAVDISSYRVLVAGGRGLKSAASFERLAELAKLLGGEVAASRAAVDAHWAQPFRQVGQTGKTVAPRLYIAFGISGAIQHLEGIRGAEKIIAVNNDPNAPIFNVANVGIVGDANEVLSALIREFAK